VTDLVLRDAASLVLFPDEVPLRGSGFESIETAENVSLSVEGGLISAIDGPGDAETTFDATGCTVVPGFVDCHTHLPFYGWRADEDAARLSGVRYEQLHGQKGGIFRSARMLAEASDEEVLTFSRTLADRMLACGTTSFETKSGYGLSLDAELRQLRLAGLLSTMVSQRVVPTCLAAHAVPEGMDAGEWISIAAEDLIPKAVELGLCTAIDLYVETIAFALEHAARLAHVAEQLELRKRVHADQLADNQTASFATRWGFATCDHLNNTSPEGVDDLAESDTVAVLLPGATFTLRQDAKPPARALIDRGAVVALGTDLNPGTSPVHSMPFVMGLACRTYGLRPLEALAAATVNAAFALDLERVGRIAPGWAADLVVLDMPSLDHLAYRPDRNPVLATIVGGKLVHVAAEAKERVVGSV
jgi:imidazolonepropionase